MLIDATCAGDHNWHLLFYRIYLHKTLWGLLVEQHRCVCYAVKRLHSPNPSSSPSLACSFPE